MFDSRNRNAADLRFVQCNGGLPVSLAYGALKPGDIAGLEQSDDALRTIGKILHQLDETTPDNVDCIPFFPCLIKQGMRLARQIMDRFKNLIQRFIRNRCQYSLAADGAVNTVCVASQRDMGRTGLSRHDSLWVKLESFWGLWPEVGRRTERDLSNAEIYMALGPMGIGNFP